MKTLTIDVPKEGASIQLVFRGKYPPSKAVIITDDDIEIKFKKPELQDVFPVPQQTKPTAKAPEKPAVKDLFPVPQTKSTAKAAEKLAAIPDLFPVPQTKPVAKAAEKPAFDYDKVANTLFEMHTRNQSTALNVIKTMFQFSSPITPQTAKKILEELKKRGDIKIDADGDLEFPKHNAVTA